MALVAESGELIEHFQWLTEEQSRQLPPPALLQVEDELADVFIYLTRLADKLNIDLLAAAARKMERNAQRYPADRVKGSAKKYNEYPGEEKNG